LSAALDDAAQRAVIDDLQRRRYAAGTAAGDVGGTAPAEAFKRGFAWRQTGTGDHSDDALPPLYPFKLR
jgi:hypothetical protein